LCDFLDVLEEGIQELVDWSVVALRKPKTLASKETGCVLTSAGSSGRTADHDGNAKDSRQSGNRKCVLTSAGSSSRTADHDGNAKDGGSILLAGQEIELLGHHLPVQAHHNSLPTKKGQRRVKNFN
jgi:hypothetical protein